jgi:RHS repeat-associated protein
MDAIRYGAGVAVAFALVVPGLMSANADTAGGELAADTLASITGLTPQDFGAATVDGLEYADPTEALGIIEAPVPNSDGSVELSFPIGVPPGHGITPELTVQYGSGGGNGWMGEGWDLGVGEITVDTTFGAPHFAQNSESESYLLDGALLTPNANADTWEPRVIGDRNDFTRQVETEYDEIIRHQVGSGWPADYFWEVRGKDGSVKWYGGTPDSGGPVPSTEAAFAPTLDETAVIRNEAGHIVTWLLSAERDIGVNLIRYEYDTVEYEFDGADWQVFAGDCAPAAQLCGQHTYLDRILYTDATSSIADRNGAPYEIDFLRESEPFVGNTSTLVRKDPIVDAGLGYVDVIVDRLARVEVKHGVPPASGTNRDYTAIAARYDFRYAEGRFGKTLLSTIIQGVDDPHEHVIEYYDDLTGTTTVAGFAAGEDWTTADDIDVATYLDETAEVSVLGGSETNGGSGNIYIGFNPISPSKTFSFGVGIELSGSDTKALAEWIDLNGDNLPDKVFVKDGKLQFRLNASGPDGGGFAGGAAPVVEDVTDPNDPQDIDELSQNSNFAFQISAEAYPVVALGIGTGLAFSWTNTYFSDVNGDGLVDFVRHGTVYFNTLNDDDIPTFSTSSATTPIPLEPSPLPDITSEELDELSDTLALQSPPLDTVRRWVAPFDGTISIVAPVTLTGASADGVRVAVQHNGGELIHADLTTGASAFADPTPELQDLVVAAGDNVYFRVGAGPDGTDDLVSWSPVITYQSPAWPEFDVNGLSQWEYAAESDFTLAGRPNDFIAMPATGTALIEASVTATAPLTDDVTLVLVRRDFLGVDHPTPLGTIPADTPPADAAAALDVAANIAVTLTEWDDPATPGSDLTTVADKLSVYLAADSPVDLSAIDFSANITYTDVLVDGTTPVPGPVDAGGDPIALFDAEGAPTFLHHVRPHVEIYPYADRTVPADDATITGDNDVVLAVTALADVPDDLTTVVAIITVKTADDGLLHKVLVPLTVVGNTASGTADLDIPAGSGARYLDISIRDNVFSRGGLELTTFATTDGVVETPIENATLRWSGMQGIFPQPYRGWGVAGYTAAGALGASAIVESAFVIDTASYSTEEPTRADISLDDEHAEPSYAFIPAVDVEGTTPEGTTAEPVATDRWVGPRANLYGDATAMGTSLLAVDSVDFSGVTSAPDGAGGRSAPTRLGITGPGLTLSFGVGILGASAGLSPSFGLTDFEDLNGDGYPDVVSTGNVTYTNQLGAYLPSRSVTRTSVTNQDLTISINGGLSAGMVDINANPKGSTNSVSGDAAGKGSSASDSGPSYSLGISGSGGYSWSSPNASGGSGDPGDSTYAEQVSTLESDFGSDGSEIQRAFADVNGDGLPDSVYTNASGTFAYYNLGYGFTAHAVQLGDGGFESRESAVGGFGAGFSLPYGEFGGGVNFLWNYDWSTYTWNDINGDGILDQLRRHGDNDIKIRFGTGSGLLAPVSYGAFATVPVSPGIPASQHMSFDRSSGVGGGVSATGYIGPLCLVACYLVIGGGGGYNNSRSSSSADIEDVNGDGYADALLSLNDDKLTVALNQQNRTNFLMSVTNPLGGSFTVDYERQGNTVDHPDSIWVMSRLDIYDGRSTDGATPAGTNTTGHYASTIDYAGLDYSRTHRASLGFDTVTVTELDTVDGDTPVRINEQLFLNDNIFVKGLLTEATMYEPDGAGRVAVRGSTVTWGFRDVRAIAAHFDSQAPAATNVAVIGDVDTVGSRGRSIAPLISDLDEYWYDVGKTFSKRTEYQHDGLGNVIVEDDLGAPDDPFDDLRTEIDYSDCTAAPEPASDTINGCLPVSDPRAPFWSPGMCVNWASFPTRVSVFGVDPDDATQDVLLRERLSPVQMCDNGAATVLQELVSNEGGTKVYATSNLTLNQYGDYALVMAPAGADGIRYTVRYEYDTDRHSDISSVEEFDVTEANAAAVLASGPTPANSTAGISSSATFDPLSGRVASKTDGNGARRDYVYDEHGRIVSTSTMAATPAGATSPLITYEYHANAAGYGYAIASHADSFDGNDPPAGSDDTGGDTTATIDTITFVDGLGRVRQTKRDARLSLDGGLTTVNTRQVTDGVEFDVLARPAILYGPTADPGAAAAFSPDGVDGVQTVTEWFSYDLPYTITEPGDRTTEYNYPWIENDAGVLLAHTEAIDPDGRLTVVGQDVRDVQRLHIDQAAPRPGDVGDPERLITEYLVNSLGELRGVVDSTGAVTEYDYDLTGKTTRASTPNGGTVEYSYDLAGNQRVMINEAMAAIGEQTTYEYAFNRLTNIDHPGTVDDITYEYGLDNTDGRYTAGRIRHIEDRTRLVDNTYDKNGAMIEQTAIIKRHNWRPTMTAEELLDFTYTTRWSYDPLGRIETVGYPDAKTVSFLPDGESVAALTAPEELTPLLQSIDLDGEVATYDYDSGGLLREVTGAEEGIVFVDEAITPDLEGNPRTVLVPRRVTHEYAYLNDRVYEPRLLAIRDEMGNGTISDYSFDVDTRWLESKQTTSPNPDPAVATRVEVQDLSYTYDPVGRPLTYDNDLPLANRAINGGDVHQQFSYDGFGRLRGASGTFDLKAGEQQRFTYGVEFTPDAPWSVIGKDQHDALFTTQGKPKMKVNEERTYDFARDLQGATGTGGPLHAVSDELTVGGETTTYDFAYNPNGAIDSMLAAEEAPVATTTTTVKKGKPKPEPTPVASETNVWDRMFTWTLMNQLTSASDGSELRTFAYDDTGALMIQDGNLLSRDGAVIHESGGGPETIFLNAWVTVKSQKIYKHVRDGLDTIATKMDSGAGYEAKQMFIHTDVVGSTNAVTDDLGRGFQRHEYFPSGEIWINDHKEEIRTPFQFADGYYEDEFDLVLFGARWYDTERELFLSPDPLLSSDVQALIDQPALGGAYTYAGANAVGNVDPSGLRFFGAHQRVDVKAKAQESFEIDQFVLKITGEGSEAQTKLNKRIKQLEGQARAEAVLEPNAIIKIDLAEGTVSVGAPYGPRKEWTRSGGNSGSAAAPTDDSALEATSDDDADDATDGSGGPDAGGDGASPGSATIDVAGDDADSGSDSDSDSDSSDGQPPPMPDQQGAAGDGDLRLDD